MTCLAVPLEPIATRRRAYFTNLSHGRLDDSWIFALGSNNLLLGQIHHVGEKSISAQLHQASLEQSSTDLIPAVPCLEHAPMGLPWGKTRELGSKRPREPKFGEAKAGTSEEKLR